MVDGGRFTVEGGWVRRGFVGILVLSHAHGTAQQASPLSVSKVL